MNSTNTKTYHQLKLYKKYNHIYVSVALGIFGLLMLFSIPTFPKNLIVTLLFIFVAFTIYQIFKTTKPIIIHKDHICLGKLVTRYKKSIVNANTIVSIDLVYEIKTEFRPSAALIGGDVDVHSNYFQIKLTNNSHIQFDNLYDKQLQNDLKHWCKENNIELNLEVKKVIKENDDWE